MWNSQEHVTWLGIPLFDKLLQDIAEGSVTRLVPLNYLSYLLVYDQKVIIFVDYAGGDVFVIHCRAKIMTFCQKISGGTAFVIKKSVSFG